jgi:hypothetical protein
VAKTQLHQIRKSFPDPVLAGFVLAILSLKLGLKLLKALLILILLAFVALLITFVFLALQKWW